MKLPYAHLAEVSQEKVIDYLLCPWHRNGGPKCRFFHPFGFSRDSWDVFAQALKLHAQTLEVRESRTSPFGVSFSIDGPMPTPDGREANVRSVWFVTSSDPIPRLVTAYPAPDPDNA